MPMRRAIFPLLFLVLAGSSFGCVRRTLSITSTPSDALVWVNHREVGRTPLTVDFTHYGTYDVRIERAGMEPVMTSRKAHTPVWDLPGPDLVVEVLPFQAHSNIEWHFDLEPRDGSMEALVERARDFRQEAKGVESGAIEDPGIEKMNLNNTQPPAPTSEPSKRPTDAFSQENP